MEPPIAHLSPVVDSVYPAVGSIMLRCVLVDMGYPGATVVRVVLDNLNTHRMTFLYETFPAAEARRMVKRFEFHHTPEHASWLNTAEIEFSVLSRACLKGRNPDADALQLRITVYEAERNAAGAPSTGASAPTTPDPNCIASIPAIPSLIEY